MRARADNAAPAKKLRIRVMAAGIDSMVDADVHSEKVAQWV